MTDLRRGTRPASKVSLTVLTLALVVSACGEDADPGTTGIELQDPELVDAGAGLYSAKCAVCHGDDLRGTSRGPSHLSEVYVPSHHGDGAFEVAVLAGSPQHHWNFGAMPAIDGLDESDIDAIVAFVRERQRTEGFEPYPP